MDIAHYRLMNQQVTRSAFSAPGELIAWMGCIQAEDYASAKWAIGNRIPHITDAAIEKAFNEGHFFRAQVLRPAWHFVNPADIGWLRQLSSQKIRAFYKTLHGKLDISNSDLKRSKNIITKALSDQQHITRAELLALCRKAKIRTDDIRINFLLMDAELDGLIVNGGRRGNEFVYTLLEDAVSLMEKDAAIAELTKRYFNSRGPATLHDFVWWSGLEMAEAQKGLEMNKTLQHAVINGQAYWFFETPEILTEPSVSLLPSFDEYAVGYKDRSDTPPEYKPAIIINGHVAGTWKHSEQQHKIVIETQLFSPVGKKEAKAVISAGDSYARFLGKAI